MPAEFARSLVVWTEDSLCRAARRKSPKMALGPATRMEQSLWCAAVDLFQTVARLAGRVLGCWDAEMANLAVPYGSQHFP
jgi:hypothetical protein